MQDFPYLTVTLKAICRDRGTLRFVSFHRGLFLPISGEPYRPVSESAKSLMGYYHTAMQL